MKLDIRPLTADLWPAFEDLFGKRGACNGCWCMYWRIGAAYRKRPREKNKAAFKRIVKKGPAAGLRGYPAGTFADLAVGETFNRYSVNTAKERKELFATMDRIFAE